MLRKFTVSNFLSFKDESSINLTATADNEYLENTFQTAHKGLSLLKSAALYGSNSNGKSNFLKGLTFFKWFVLNSSKDFQAEESIDVSCFRLSTSTIHEPSCFEIEFIIDQIKYRYGFKVDQKMVHSEWLYYAKKIKEYKLFERKGATFDLSSKLDTDLELKRRTRPNALFLSVLAQWNNDLATSILKELNDIHFISGNNDQRHLKRTASLLSSEKYGTMIRKMVNGADLGISNLLAQKVKITTDMLEGLPNDLQEFILKEKSEDMFVKTEHRVYDENKNEVDKIHFDLESNESSGTIKYIALAGPIIETLLNGTTLIIDELGARMHPILTKAIVSIFNSEKNNPLNSQLIFTTHNSSLLSDKIFRRDQIVMVKKDQYGASQLETLYDIKIRKDASFEKDYLIGKYEAIPSISLDISE